MPKNALRFGLVLGVLLFAASVWSAPPALMQGPIVLDGVAGEWDPSWQVATDPLDVFTTDMGLHPHEPPTYARSGYDATALWAHYDVAGTTWYFRLDVDGRVADSDSQTGTSGNLGVGTHGPDSGPLVEPPFDDNDGIGQSEKYSLGFQYQSGGPGITSELGGDSSILPGILAATTAGLTGQGIYSTTATGTLEWAFARDVIFPSGSNHGELWLSAQMGDNNDRVSDDNVSAVLLIALDQTVGCPASPAILGYQATFSAVYTVSTAAALGVNDVMLTVNVPTGTSFVSASDGGTESGGVITWNLGNLSPGDTGQVTFTLHIDGVMPSLTLDSEIACAEGLRYLSSTGCPVREPYLIHLPVVQNNYRAEPLAPDLVVVDIAATDDGRLRVIIENEGSAPVTEAFWVDVYIDPHPIPTGINQIWNDLADQGLVWGVTEDALPLAHGDILTLTAGDIYYWPEYSEVSWPVSTSKPVYAQVDSANTETTYGAVLETHELAGGDYNNITGPMYLTHSQMRQVYSLTSPVPQSPLTTTGRKTWQLGSK